MVFLANHKLINSSESHYRDMLGRLDHTLSYFTEKSPPQTGVYPSNGHCKPLMDSDTPAEPLSPFAQWQLDEDRMFYATFPEAREANQRCFQHTLCPEFQYDVTASIDDYTAGETIIVNPTAHVNVENDQSITLCNQERTPAMPYTIHCDYSPGNWNHACTFTSYASDYTNAQPSYASSIPVPPSTNCTIQRSSDHPSPAAQHSPNSLPHVSIPSVEVTQGHPTVASPHQLQHIPSQPPATPQEVVTPSHEPEPPLMDHLPSPPPTYSEEDMASNLHGSFSPASHPRPIYNIKYEPQIESSGHWRSYNGVEAYQLPEPSPVYAGGPIFIESGSLPPSPLTRFQDPHHNLRRQVRPHLPHFHTSRPSARPPGWQSPRIRLSPLPSKRPLEKKPPLACLFCRGRKIACGPPEPGTTDKTCNQCQRRSIPCEYPSESRRGMRAKKSATASVNAAGPKVKLRKRSKG